MPDAAPSYQPRQPSRSQWRTLRGQPYHLRLWGAPEAPPLLLHGWMDVSASFQFLVDALPAAFLAQRLIVAPDWRGFGLSLPAGPTPDYYPFADYLADLDDLLRQCWGERAVDLLGHSMGGHVAMLYAGARPQRVRRLINLEGFGLPDAAPEQAPSRYAQWLDELHAQRQGQRRLRPYPSLSAVAQRLMRNNPRLPQAQARWLAAHWAQALPQPGGGVAYHVRAADAHRVVNPQLFRLPEVLALYRNISAPVLMVQAQDDSLAQYWGPRYTRAEFAQRLRHVPRARTHTLPNCGHMLHHDQPQALAALLTDFLAAPAPQGP